MNTDPRSADSDRWDGPGLRRSWVVAPLVSALVVLIVVGLGTLLWHRPVGAEPIAEDGRQLAALSIITLLVQGAYELDIGAIDA